MSSGKWLARSFRTRSGLIQWGLFLAAIAFVAYIVIKHGEEFKAALQLTPQIFILITVASFATFALNGIELQILAGKFKRDIPFGEGLILGLMVSTLNYLPMKTGTVLNGVLMRARYRLPLSDFTALIAGSSVVHLWMCGVLAGGSLLIAGTEIGWGLAFLITPTVFVAGLILWGAMRKTGRFQGHDSRLVRAASRAVDGVGLMFSDPVLLAKDVSINIGLVGLWALRSYWSFQAIGVHASYGQVLTVTALGILFTRLSVIPGGVGFREAGAAFGSAITGLPAGAGFAAAVIERTVMLIWLLVVGVPASLYLLHKTGIGLDDAVRSGTQGGELEDGTR